MTAALTLDLVQRFPKNGPTDPIEYYRRRSTGWLFRERINLGLRMLREHRFERALEVGYGAGAVQVALAPICRELHGIDLDADPALTSSVLDALGVHSHLRAGNVYDLPYDAETFDLVASFSTFEHLSDFDRALAEVRRVLRPGGRFLLGMPSVNRIMEVGFHLIGFRGIDDHHVTTPQQVRRRFAFHGLSLRASARLRLPFPGVAGIAVYHDWLLERV